jgi:membrane associated rhomboid family serine protease
MARTRCTICGKPASYRCKYCGDTLCEEHLSPEMHWCVALEEYRKDLAAGRTSSIPMELKPESIRWEHDKKVTSPFGIFSGNYSFLLLFLISISFVLQLLIPRYTEHLILIPALVTERPWTLVTHIFLHGSFMHFLVNMFVFFFFAPTLERKIGSSKFLLIFFLAGIVAGIGWCLTSINPALGASGALYGVLGALALLMPKMKVYIFPLPIPVEIWIVVIFFALFFDVLPVIMGSPDGIAHTAHLSGLFFGLLAGMRLKKTF